jgi:septal ring factor EnvC (AmiA/AmiB activator)
MTREEVDAKILANEARSDAQVAAILAKIDGIIATIEDLKQQIRTLHVAFVDLKKTVILTGISSVLAIMFGMAGFNAALLSNMTGAFESGKDTGQWQSDMRKQSDETRQSLSDMRKQSEENRQWQGDMQKQREETRQWQSDIRKQNEETRQSLSEMRKQSAETSGQLLEMRKQREQAQQLLETIRQERASGRR